jgi:hypothetical protein
MVDSDDIAMNKDNNWMRRSSLGRSHSLVIIDENSADEESEADKGF